MLHLRLSLQVEARKRNKTPTQETSLQEKRTSLLKRIQRFREIQLMYMPGLQAHLDRTDSPTSANDTSRPELMAVHLPSFFPAQVREPLCLTGVPQIEDRLRFAHAFDALEDLHRQLQTRMLAIKFKTSSIRSQRAFTRSQTLLHQIDAKINSARDRYQAARNALLQLRGPGDWEETLRELRAEDIQGISERVQTQEEKDAEERVRWLAGRLPGDEEPSPQMVSTRRLAVGEGHQVLSWIWYSISAAEAEGGAGAMHDCIRVEWVKAWARAERWREEVILLEEEMRRVLEFCQWKAGWWENQPSRRHTDLEMLTEGLPAYATEQAETERMRAQLWAEKWAPVQARAHEALKDYLDDVADEMGGFFQEIEVELDLEDDDLEEDTED
jgi:hypothetical protein